MNFKPLGTDKTKTLKVQTKLGEVDFKSTFSENDLVTVKKYYKDFSTEYKAMYGKQFIVNYCKISELTDMITEVVYLKPKSTDGTVSTCNPYLVKHFEAVVSDNI